MVLNYFLHNFHILDILGSTHEDRSIGSHQGDERHRGTFSIFFAVEIIYSLTFLVRYVSFWSVIRDLIRDGAQYLGHE